MNRMVKYDGMDVDENYPRYCWAEFLMNLGSEYRRPLQIHRACSINVTASQDPLKTKNN